MTPFDEAVLTRAMRQTQAWERLNNPEYSGSLTMAQFHDLMLEAGYSPKVAREAAKHRGWQRLEAGVTI